LSQAQERSPSGFGSPPSPDGDATRTTGTAKTGAASLELVEFDRERAIASLDEGKPVIPVWLDVIYQQLMNKLAG
jgi:hypothetical protein